MPLWLCCTKCLKIHWFPFTSAGWSVFTSVWDANRNIGSVRDTGATLLFYNVFVMFRYQGYADVLEWIRQCSSSPVSWVCVESVLFSSNSWWGCGSKYWVLPLGKPREPRVFFFLFLIGVERIYNTIFVSGVQHNDLIYICKMVTTVSLVNICHHTVLQNFFFLWWGLLRPALSNFQICNVLLTVSTVLHISSPRLNHFCNQQFVLLAPFTHFSHSHPQHLATTNLLSISMGSVFCCCCFCLNSTYK